MKRLHLVGVAALVLGFVGQAIVPGRAQNVAERADRGPFDALHFRSIGPASMSGRISDVAVYEADPAVYYVGTAHGGVWKTTNNGTTFEAQFEDHGLMSIGDVTISQSNPDLVWVGTGESNNRQSTSWGDGVYKSTDGGKTYRNLGLRTSRHINRILIDPRDNNVVFVAATGSLWGPGGDRGVFKSIDGGNTWKHVLKVDDDTGANDLAMDPSDSQTIYASTYQRRRTACCMNGGGPGSGIWKSTDAGETWTRVKGGVLDQTLGRIALDVYRRRPNILYALIEGPAPQGRGRGGAASGGEGLATPAEQGGGRGRGQQPLNSEPTGLYRSDDSGATWRKVNNANPRPMYFSQVRIDPNDPEVVYLGGVGLHLTTDGGKTIATDVAESTHDDVHAIWINPSNSNHVLIGNDGGLAVSWDMGKTWNFVPNLPVGLFYHVSYDMATPFNVCGGMQDNYNWCGPSQVRGSAGIAGFHWATLQGGDGFVVLQDPTEYRIAFSESQDGNIVRVDRVTGETIGVRPAPAPGEPPLRWHWDTPIALSPHDPKVVWAAANKVFRSSDRGLSWVAVSNDLTNEADRDEIEVMGVKGRDITIAKNDGIQAWPTIVSFAESPKRAGVLYAGTDDGNLQMTRDGGKKWVNLFEEIQGVPKQIYVSDVVPSRFDEATVYATFDGHRQNDFATYIFASTDYGQTWRSISSNLKGEVARTLTEDLKNPDVLYLGTETGLFVTLDRGRSWNRIKANLPTVRIDEITLHPRDNAMILGTHGRAIWILDSLSPIQEYASVQGTPAAARLFSPPPSIMYRRPTRDRNYEFWGDQVFYGENPPQAAVVTWLLKRDVGQVKLRVIDPTGREVREISGEVLASVNNAGIHSACWDLRVQPAPPVALAAGRGGRGGEEQGSGRQGGQGGGQQQQRSPFGAGCAVGGGFGVSGGGGGSGAPGPWVLPGLYTVELIVDGRVADSKSLRLVSDPEVVLTSVERKRMFDMAMEMHDLHRRGAEVANELAPINRQLPDIAKTVATRTDLPVDVKSAFESLNKEISTTATRFGALTGGGRGFGGRGDQAENNPLARIGQAKNALMATMPMTEQTTRAYNDARTQVPKVLADARELVVKAREVSASLAKYNITLTVPPVTAKPTTSAERN